MAKSIFSKNEPRCCGYCLNGRSSNMGDKILCENKGIVDPSFSCRKFKYDPLKRVPRRPPLLPEYNEDEFKL